jgi:V8-like Glu-specific endopeptidase
MKRIEEIRDMYPDHNDRFMVVCTPKSRWTAIVQLDKNTGGYAFRYDGFMTI